MNAERKPVNALAFGMMILLCMLWGFQPVTMKLAAPHISLVMQAGGAATDGRTRILDIQPTALHQRIGVIIGSKNEVQRVTTYHAQG